MELAIVSAQPPVTAVLTAISFLIGSIPSGVLLGSVLSNADVRKSGSGNIGAANVARVAGRRVGALVLVADLVKGVIPVLIGRFLGLNPIDLAVVGGAAVIGHDFSVFLRFHGGKGVATTFGVAAALAFPPAVIAAAIWVTLTLLTRVSAIGSLVALWFLALLMAVFDEPVEFVCLFFGLSILCVFTHRDNIARLSRGKENRVIG